MRDWLPQARLREILVFLFAFFGCEKITEKGGLIERFWETFSHDVARRLLVEYLGSLGVTREEMVRFHFWALELKLEFFPGPWSSASFKAGEAEAVLGAVLRIALEHLVENPGLIQEPELRRRLDLLFGHSELLETEAMRVNIHPDLIRGAAHAVSRRLLDRLYALASTGFLTHEG